ncbi:MAG: alpha-L-fucosidase [Mobilitalea sp.]
MQRELERINEVIKGGPYLDNWSSLASFEVPNWFQKAKFGIFVHWGLYSIPAFNNEWYSRNMYIQGTPEYEHHIATYGPHKDFGYKDFIPMFTAEKFNPKEWSRLFKEAGAKYVFPVAEHHEGFQMYDSDISEFNSVKMGPKRDVLGELKKAFEEDDLVFCTSSHRAEHLWFMGNGKDFESDIKEPLKRGDFYWPSLQEQPNQEDIFAVPYPFEEFLDDWLVRTCELIDKYQPRLLYFDWWIQHEGYKKHLLKIAAYYYNRGVQWGFPTAICYKHEAMSFGTGIVDMERGKFANVQPFYWQTDTSVAHNSWCYTETLDYKTSYDLICNLVDVVSKNGNLLLNVCPKADGSMPEMDQKLLKDIGKWLSINGEAIYNSKVWRSFGEGPTKDAEGKFSEGNQNGYTSEDFRFTVANGHLYATLLKYPKDGKVCIKSLSETADANAPRFYGIIRDIEILGFSEKIDWQKDHDGLHFITTTVSSEFPVVIKIITD